FPTARPCILLIPHRGQQPVLAGPSSSWHSQRSPFSSSSPSSEEAVRRPQIPHVQGGADYEREGISDHGALAGGVARSGATGRRAIWRAGRINRNAADVAQTRPLEADCGEPRLLRSQLPDSSS